MTCARNSSGHSIASSGVLNQTTRLATARRSSGQFIVLTFYRSSGSDLPSPVTPGLPTIKGSSLKFTPSAAVQDRRQRVALELNHFGVLQVADAVPKRGGSERLVGKEVKSPQNAGASAATPTRSFHRVQNLWG